MADAADAAESARPSAIDSLLRSAGTRVGRQITRSLGARRRR